MKRLGLQRNLATPIRINRVPLNEVGTITEDEGSNRWGVIWVTEENSFELSVDATINTSDQ